MKGGKKIKGSGKVNEASGCTSTCCCFLQGEIQAQSSKDGQTPLSIQAQCCPLRPRQVWGRSPPFLPLGVSGSSCRFEPELYPVGHLGSDQGLGNIWNSSEQGQWVLLGCLLRAGLIPLKSMETRLEGSRTASCRVLTAPDRHSPELHGHPRAGVPEGALGEPRNSCFSAQGLNVPISAQVSISQVQRTASLREMGHVSPSPSTTRA